MIRDSKWRGVLQCTVIAVASVLAVSGDRFGFDGEILALIFIGIVLCIFFARKFFKIDKQKKI